MCTHKIILKIFLFFINKIFNYIFNPLLSYKFIKDLLCNICHEMSCAKKGIKKQSSILELQQITYMKMSVQGK